MFALPATSWNRWNLARYLMESLELGPATSWNRWNLARYLLESLELGPGPSAWASRNNLSAVLALSSRRRTAKTANISAKSAPIPPTLAPRPPRKYPRAAQDRQCRPQEPMARLSFSLGLSCLQSLHRQRKPNTSKNTLAQESHKQHLPRSDTHTSCLRLIASWCYFPFGTRAPGTMLPAPRSSRHVLLIKF